MGEECFAVRTAVGINEIHNFSKFEVCGDDAESWLDTVMAGRLPKVGRLTLSPMLSPAGKLIGDFTIARLEKQNVFLLNASYGAQSYHQRWFEQHLPDAGVSLRNVSQQRLGFQIAGPNARKLLQRVARGDVSNDALPFLSIRSFQIGPCEAIVQRVSYTGDLGYEIYVPANQQLALYDVLSNAGSDLGLRPFGMRAMMSLRLEKSFGSWLREYKPDYCPVETGMDRFVAYNKTANFIGKEAALKDKQHGTGRKLCTFIVDADDADVVADEPIWADNKVIGFVTSGGYAHYCKKSVAIGFLPTEMISPGKEVEIELLGQRRKATLFEETLFDPKARRMRG